MKIFRIIARLNVGGPARHVVWLTKNLQNDEFQSVLIAGTVPDGEGDMSYFAVENGVEPTYIAELSRVQPTLKPVDVRSDPSTRLAVHQCDIERMCQFWKPNTKNADIRLPLSDYEPPSAQNVRDLNAEVGGNFHQGSHSIQLCGCRSIKLSDEPKWGVSVGNT